MSFYYSYWKALCFSYLCSVQNIVWQLSQSEHIVSYETRLFYYPIITVPPAKKREPLVQSGIWERDISSFVEQLTNDHQVAW